MVRKQHASNQLHSAGNCWPKHDFQSSPLLSAGLCTQPKQRMAYCHKYFPWMHVPSVKDHAINSRPWPQHWRCIPLMGISLGWLESLRLRVLLRSDRPCGAVIGARAPIVCRLMSSPWYSIWRVTWCTCRCDQTELQLVQHVGQDSTADHRAQSGV